MRRALSLTDISILIIAMVMSLFFFLNGRMTTPTTHINFEQNYEMPRPNKWFRQYLTLLGKNIVRIYNNPFAKKEDIKGVQYRNQAVAPPPPAKSTVANKDAKKNVKKASTLQVMHTNTQRNMDLSKTSENQNEQEYSYETATPAETPKAEPKAKKAKKVVSKEEWENRILSDRSLKTITEYAKEYKAGSVTDADFYSLITSLIKNTDPFKAGLGVYALGLTPSVKSFETLAIEGAMLPAETKEQASLTLNRYAEFENFPILNSVILGSEEPVQLIALEVLEYKVKSILNPTASTSTATPTPAPAPKTPLSSADVYKKFAVFIATLNQLFEQSSSNSVKEASQVLLKQIESLHK